MYISLIVCRFCIAFKYGIAPTSHQATIYPLSYLKQNLYRLDIGIAADQISILNLITSRKIIFRDNLVICKFKGEGIGDTQAYGAFFKQMFAYRWANSTKTARVFEFILFFPIIVIKLIFSVRYRLKVFLKK